MQPSHKYEPERLELKAKIKTLRQKLSECGQREQERKLHFGNAILFSITQDYMNTGTAKC